MPIHLDCLCGANLVAAEMFAGGRVKCDICGQMLAVPEKVSPGSPTIHFQCPHCAARVVARAASAGKRSRCPACGAVYGIPQPILPREEASFESKRRFEIGPDDIVVLPDMLERLRGELNLPRLTGRSTDADTNAPSEDETHLLRPARNSVSLQQQPKANPPVTQRETEENPPDDSIRSSKLDRTTEFLEAELWGCGRELANRKIRVSTRKFLIGRARDCHLRPSSPLVSNHHCVLLTDAYSVCIRDLGSRHGTTLNGRPVRGPTVLRHSDQLCIGDVSLKFVLPWEMLVEDRTAGLSLDEFDIR